MSERSTTNDDIADARVMTIALVFLKRIERKIIKSDVFDMTVLNYGVINYMFKETRVN